MQEVKNTQRALVRIGYDGLVHKTFRGPQAYARFENEVRVLKHLEARGCGFVPRLVESDAATLKIVTTNCGSRVEQVNAEKLKSLFDELETYGVRHDDPGRGARAPGKDAAHGPGQSTQQESAPRTGRTFLPAPCFWHAEAPRSRNDRKHGRYLSPRPRG